MRGRRRLVVMVWALLCAGAVFAGGDAGAHGTAHAAACTPPAGVTVPCDQRLAITLPANEIVGRYVLVPLTDRWGIGDLKFFVCEQPPGGVRACRPEHLRLGQSHGTARLDLRRPGGYEISVTAAGGGVRHERLIWVNHRDQHFTVLAAGDSEMEVLDDDLKTDLAPYGVTVDEDARPSTGLTVPGSFSWLAEAKRDVDRYRPDVTIIAMGANEGYAIPDAQGQEVNCCGRPWQVAYGNRVRAMGRTFLRHHRGHTYWMKLPAPRPPAFQALFDEVNSGIDMAVARSRNRVNLLDADAFFTPDNHYRDEMTYHGHSFVIHESDGIHLDASADAVEAQLIVQRLLADHEIRPHS